MGGCRAANVEPSEFQRRDEVKPRIAGGSEGGERYMDVCKSTVQTRMYRRSSFGTPRCCARQTEESGCCTCVHCMGMTCRMTEPRNLRFTTSIRKVFDVAARRVATVSHTRERHTGRDRRWDGSSSSSSWEGRMGGLALGLGELPPTSSSRAATWDMHALN